MSDTREWPRIAVVGAGAVGGYFGGMFARAGAPTVFIGRKHFAEAVNSKGLVLDKSEGQQRIRAIATVDMHPTDKAARVAGAVYLSMVFTAPFTLLYIPSKLIVRGNATATANNILAHETMFRLAILGDLVTAVIFICLGIALYRLLSGVNKTWAMLMVAFVLISSAVGFLDTLNNIAALILFRGGDFLTVFEKPQLNALGYLFIRLHNQGIFINELFWGLWLFPFGLLVFRSGFLPRFIGVWLMINCFGYVALSIIALFAPDYYAAAFKWAQPLLFGELAIMRPPQARGRGPRTFTRRRCAVPARRRDHGSRRPKRCGRSDIHGTPPGSRAPRRRPVPPALARGESAGRRSRGR